MDADLFTPQDAAALFAIRAANAQRAMSSTELLAAFGTEGLLCEAPTATAHLECKSTPVQATEAWRYPVAVGLE